MAKKSHNPGYKNSKTKDIVIMFLLTIFMLCIPFYRGLFFRQNYIPAIILISIIFAVYIALKFKDKSYGLVSTYMDASVLMISAAFLISFFFAVNAKDALDMFLIYFSYFMLYKLTSDLSSRDEIYKNIFINVIIASTFILSFTSMLHLAGIINIKGSFVGNRLFGLYQYANTSASVLGVGIILSLNTLMYADNIKKKVIYQMILTALIPTFIFTLSRGGYLVLAAVLFANFILVGAKAKVKLIMGLVVSFLSSSLFIYKYYSVAVNQLSDIWVQYLISIIISAIFVYIIYIIRGRVNRAFTDKSINTTLIMISIVFIGAAIFLLTAKGPAIYRIEHLPNEEESWKYELIDLNELEPKSEYMVEFETKASIESQWSYGILVRSYNSSDEYTDIINHFEPVGSELAHKTFRFATLEDTERVEIFLYNYETDSFTEYRNVVVKDSSDKLIKKMEQLKYIPKDIAARLLDINLTTENASLRIQFAKDGLKIIKDYPITGAGGGAWRNLYKQYQSIPYDTTEVHNFYIQYGTEVGIIGLVALIVLLVLLLISIFKCIKTNSKYLGVYTAAILLFAHSMIDFNLSLVSVGYILWMLIGIINSDKYTPLIKKSQQKYIGAVVLVLSVIVLFASSSIFYGMKMGNQGAIIYNTDKDEDKTIEFYEKAIKFDKYNGIYRADLAQLLNNKLRDTKDRKYYDDLLEQLSMMRKYEPHNHKYTATICNMYLSLGLLEEASELADKRLYDEPFVVRSYTVKIDVNYQIANYYLKGDKVKEAEPYLLIVVEAEDKLEEINANLEKPLKLSDEYVEKIQDVKRVLDLIKDDKKE